jgi:hypothetical protein
MWDRIYNFMFIRNNWRHYFSLLLDILRNLCWFRIGELHLLQIRWQILWFNSAGIILLYYDVLKQFTCIPSGLGKVLQKNIYFINYVTVVRFLFENEKLIFGHIFKIFYNILLLYNAWHSASPPPPFLIIIHL